MDGTGASVRTAPDQPYAVGLREHDRYCGSRPRFLLRHRVASHVFVDEHDPDDLNGRSRGSARTGPANLDGSFGGPLGRRHPRRRHLSRQGGLDSPQRGPAQRLARITQYWILHEDILQVVTVIDDPVYLEEPSVRSVAWQAHTGYRMAPYPCSARVEIDRSRGFVPHYLPGANPLLRRFSEDSGVS